MTKNVILSISGLQFETEGEEAVEVISRGEYYYRNGKHYLVYEELLEEEREVTKCVLMSEHVVELTKKGSSNVHMIFEEDATNITYYNTPYGQLIVGITTQEIKLRPAEEKFEAQIRYLLDMNYHVSECKLNITAKALE